MKFEDQALKWRKVLDSFFHKAFKKIRVKNKVKTKRSEINDLMHKRSKLKKKKLLEEEEEEEIIHLEKLIADKCEEKNRKIVMENFGEMDGADGILNHQGVWKNKRKLFPKIKPNLPVGKKNLKKQLITNPEELKELYLNTFKYRLRHRPPAYQELVELQEELFKLRLMNAKDQKSPDWTMNDLDEVLKNLKEGKCRDPEGLIRVMFMEEVIGTDLKKSMLILFNKIKDTGIIPPFLRLANIHAIYKVRGEITELDSDRGIFIVSIFRYILMRLIYKDKYAIIDKSMSHSNIGSRKKKNIRNHIFKKANEPIDIMVLDYKQLFDFEWLAECMNDVYEAGVTDNKFALIYEANRENSVAVRTPNELTRR